MGDAESARDGAVLAECEGTEGVRDADDEGRGWLAKALRWSPLLVDSLGFFALWVCSSALEADI